MVRSARGALQRSLTANGRGRHLRLFARIRAMSIVPLIASKISNINGLTNSPGEPQKVGLDSTDAHLLETGAARQKPPLLLHRESETA
jgi:hypothetical protein